MDDTAERIFLPRLPAFKENTFCVDQADTDTVEYIRADLHQKALDRIEELEAEVERLSDTLTCGHTDMPPVNIWEPDIDRQGQRCRSYSTYCPDCAEDASLAMVEQIEEIEAENRELCRALWNISVKEESVMK